MSLLDLLVPQRCLVCRQAGSQLCASCRARLVRTVPPLCERCGAPTSWPVARCRECAGRRLAFSSARAAVVYDGAARALIAGWKERGLRRVAGLAAGLVFDVVPRPDADAIAFVPPDGDRSVRRGHHPAERLARELGRRWELPVVGVLRRSPSARRQTGLSLAERRRNLAGAFTARAAPASVCLVDDVYTSGGTAAAASAALRKAGARHIQVVTFARAVR